MICGVEDDDKVGAVDCSEILWLRRGGDDGDWGWDRNGFLFIWKNQASNQNISHQ